MCCVQRALHHLTLYFKICFLLLCLQKLQLWHWKYYKQRLREQAHGSNSLLSFQNIDLATWENVSFFPSASGKFFSLKEKKKKKEKEFFPDSQVYLKTRKIPSWGRQANVAPIVTKLQKVIMTITQISEREKISTAGNYLPEYFYKFWRFWQAWD